MAIVSSEQTDLLVNPREAAKRLSISERTLWSLTDRNEIRAVRIGRSKRYALDDLRRWIESKRGGGAC
jgi:excisionase family DNA binding protein